jgi:septal ring factor EnvC (AmiA/AmiB activator)
MMEGMQEARKELAMAETTQKNMLNQLADRDREIVKLRDTLEGMEVRASKAERQVVKLHSAEKERNTHKLVMAFVVISCVAICAFNTLCPHHHNSIKQEAQVVPMMPINLAWRRLGGGISATTGEHNDPENGKNPVLGSAGSTHSSGANTEIDCFAHMSERMQKQMKEMAKELKQIQATQQRDHAQMKSLQLLMEKYGSEVEEKQHREKKEISNETEAPPEASRLRGQGLAGRIARTLSSMQ